MKFKRPIRLALPLIAMSAGILAGGCAGDGEAGDALVIDVELGNYWIAPETVTAPAGVDVALRVTNVDTSLPHSLVAAGKGTRTLDPGESQILPMGSLGAGMFPMWCDVPGHAQMGPQGTLIAAEMSEPPANG